VSELTDTDFVNPTPIFVGQNRIVALLGDYEQAGVVMLPLQRSEQLCTLQEIRTTPTPQAKIQAFDQADFVRLLRLSLDVPTELIAPFGKLEWRDGRRADGETTHGRESLGRSVYAELTNASDVPAHIPLSIPLYETIGQRQRHTIPCNVDINTGTQTLGLAPIPGAVSMALEAQATANAARLRAMLDESKAWVVLGEPYGTLDTGFVAFRPGMSVECSNSCSSQPERPGSDAARRPRMASARSRRGGRR
jgi:hypothetical protein